MKPGAGLLCLACSLATLHAGGPKGLLGEGRFARWDPSRPVRYAIDAGLLADRIVFEIARDVGVEMVHDSVAAWEGVATATLTFEDGGSLGVDVDETNFKQFTTQVTPQGNPVIFDDDGKIHEMLFGASTTVVAFANAFVTDLEDDYYDLGYVVLNGKSVDTNPDGTFRQVVTHELGHMVGLDHTQAGSQYLMYPIVGNIQGPLSDDEVWLSFLYPQPDFRETTGTITGTIRRRTGGQFFGANVVAVPATVLEGGVIQESFGGRISVVSGFEGDGSGRYELPGLPAGCWVLYIEGLLSQFTAGSGVGPYDFRFADFPKDYYNGAGESADDSDDPFEKTVLEVAAGQTLTGIDLASNESINDLASLRDDDEELYVFPDGFSFPFFGQVYREVSVNSDGNLTFGGGDSSSLPRDESRFLSSLPRIAPLFTDLDPSGGSAVISAAESGDSLKFTWDNVPEFSDGPGRPGNTFSVTLFAGGDILFAWQGIDVTADADDIQLIVGVNPGAGQGGTSSDLSALEEPLALGAAPIYEVFAGTGFDLAGTQLLFEAATASFHLLYPFYLDGAQEFTGFALTNDSAATAILTVENRDELGELRQLSDNPHLESLDSKEQLARLASEFFGSSGGSDLPGWVRIGSTAAELASFFQFGSILNGAVSALDGGVAFTEQSQVLYFSRLHHGSGSFATAAGAFDAETVLALANPNDQEITLTLRLFAADGSQTGESVQRALPALGWLRDDLGSLFAVSLVNEGFVRVDVDGPGAVGFTMVRLAETLLGFNASFPSASAAAYSAQLATASSAIFTSVKIVNVAAEATQITLTALDDGGGTLGEPFEVQLQPNESFEGEVGVILGLSSPDDVPLTGSLRVDGQGVVGDVVFGDPQQLRYAAALPLQSELVTRAIFSQVANSDSGPSDQRTFTGLAFHNPGAESVQITVRVFTPRGAESGTARFDLAALERRSETLDQLVPGSTGQVGGYVVIEAGSGVVVQELFGNLALDYLSAVPPAVFSP